MRTPKRSVVTTQPSGMTQRRTLVIDITGSRPLAGIWVLPAITENRLRLLGIDGCTSGRHTHEPLLRSRGTCRA